MADTDDVVERADALMRRRRSFVAKVRASVEQAPEPSAAAPLTAPVATALDEDADLPVLTDVVSPQDAQAGWDEAGAADEARIDDTQVALLASEIAHAIGEQLNSDLPGLIETALIDAGEQLRHGIAATMETALHDFIARRKQLPLPLDERPADDF